MDITRRTALRTAAVTGAASALTIGVPGIALAATQPTLRLGSTGTAVKSLQSRLNSLGYWVGTADGVFGPLTQQGVYAIQKAAGITRDGVVGPVTWSKVNAGTRPSVRTRSGLVVEIDKSRQLFKFVSSGQLLTTFNTSTGSGARYYSQGSWHIASTPSGTYHIFRQVNGWDVGPLGSLWRPKYFNGGIAIHGYSSVPPYPASHGCCRVSIAAMNLLWNSGRLPIGRTVLVY